MDKTKSYQNSWKLITSIWDKFSKRRKFQIVLLFILMIICGLAEMINLSALVPFLIILTDTDKIWSVPLIKYFANFLGIFKAVDLIMPITILFSITALFTGLLRVLNLWLNTKVAAKA